MENSHPKYMAVTNCTHTPKDAGACLQQIINDFYDCISFVRNSFFRIGRISLGCHIRFNNEINNEKKKKRKVSIRKALEITFLRQNEHEAKQQIHKIINNR